jgi:transporter family-2 protein
VSSGTAAAVGLAVLAGLAGSVQIAVMGRLGERIGVVEALAFAQLLTVVLVVAILLVARRSLDGIGAGFREPVWLWSGALMSALIVFTITFAAPRIGTTATIGILIAGQLAMGVAIDRWGLFGLDRIEISWPRLVGVALLAVGAALSLHKG